MEIESPTGTGFSYGHGNGFPNVVMETDFPRKTSFPMEQAVPQVMETRFSNIVMGKGFHMETYFPRETCFHYIIMETGFPMGTSFPT